MTRRRLDPAERRGELLDVGARMFAAKPYEEVLMEDVAEQAGTSRALLYRYFRGKRELFAAIYQQAADRLLDTAHFDPGTPVAGQVSAALDAHIDYFVANRNTVLAANRTLAGDRVIQTIIDDECATLQRRLLEAGGFDPRHRAAISAVLTSWLVFVRTVCVEWLASEPFSRDELRDICLGSLWGALGPYRR